MREHDLSTTWEVFLAERPALRAEYAGWLECNPRLPPRMRSHREHFIKTVGLSDADRDAWLAQGVAAGPGRLGVARQSWADAQAMFDGGETSGGVRVDAALPPLIPNDSFASHAADSTARGA